MPSPAWLETLLAEHAIWGTHSPDYGLKHGVCKCGEWRGPNHPDLGDSVEAFEVCLADHRAHVAEVLWAEIERRTKLVNEPCDPSMGVCGWWPEELLDALGADA